MIQAFVLGLNGSVLVQLARAGFIDWSLAFSRPPFAYASSVLVFLPL